MFSLISEITDIYKLPLVDTGQDQKEQSQDMFCLFTVIHFIDNNTGHVKSKWNGCG